MTKFQSGLKVVANLMGQNTGGGRLSESSRLVSRSLKISRVTLSRFNKPSQPGNCPHFSEENERPIGVAALHFLLPGKPKSEDETKTPDS